MPGTKMKFTAPALDAIMPPPKGKRALYYDTERRALVLIVTGTGYKSFYVYRRVNGKPQFHLLGPYPDLSIWQARKLAEKVNGDIAQGIDPNERKREKKAILTLGELFSEYLEKDSKKHKKTWEYDQKQYDRYLQDWKDKKIDEITRSDIQELHTKLGSLATKKAVKGGRVTANRLLALVRRMYNFAIEEKLVIDNPAKGVKEYEYKPRKRRLTSSELNRLLDSINEDHDDTIRDLASLIFFTMARPGEVRTMKWENIDFENSVWFIPDTKNGTDDLKPLSTFAIEILIRRKQEASGEYVFMGRGNLSCLKEPKRGWARILNRAGIADFHMHDLRSAMTNLIQDQGANLFSIMGLLNHKSIQATQVYVNPAIEPLRALLQSATESALRRA